MGGVVMCIPRTIWLRTRLAHVFGMIALLMALPSAASAQFFGCCNDGNVSDLKESIRGHNQHIYQLNEKFVTGWYRQKMPGPDLRQISLELILSRLYSLAPRRVALLFYASSKSYSANSSKERFCRWLISPHFGNEKFVGAASDLTLNDLKRLQSDIIDSLGVIALARDKMPIWKGESLLKGQPDGNRPDALGRAKAALLPDSFVSALKSHRIDTLIVMPIFELGTIPFSLLPIEKGSILMDLVSVTVAPGFFIFVDEPRKARTEFPRALIFGNSSGWDKGNKRAPAVQLFEAEASAVATVLGTQALPPSSATKMKVERTLREEQAPTLIYIAAHGRADETNPLDGSFLLLKDGPWTGREISKTPLGKTNPLVVLSACQTGLGKNFDVGNIGLARAWHQAGASNVVMSLWSVYQQSTQELMTKFAALVQTCPPDKALRQAMLAQRTGYPDSPANWAGFTVFGLPERTACETANGQPCGEPETWCAAADNSDTAHPKP
jgi:hypothetical protein